MSRTLILLVLVACLTGCNLIHDIFGPKPHHEDFSVTIATTGQGSVSRNPNQTRYSSGSQVQLTAVAQPGNVFTSWSGAAAGSQNPITLTVNSNISVTANFAASLAKLTVVKAGLGAGTVTGTGINCGSDCTEMLAGTVVLTATPATGATFDSWVGCDNVAANQCTVNLSSDRTVTAHFSLPVSAPQVTVPATSSNGSYQVTIKCVSALCSTSISLQEAPTAAFVNPVQTFYANSPDPLIVSYSGKAPGTYCYRAAFTVPNWGSSACVTVTAPTVAVLRIKNQSSYDLIDIRLNSVQHADYPYGIAVGNYTDFTFTTSGNVSYSLGNGFYNPDGSRDVWFTFTGSISVTLGQTAVLTINNLTIGQLLSVNASQNWDGMYFDNDANSYFARFRFTRSTNGWQLFDSTAPCFGGSTCNFSQVGSGTVRLLSWPAYSPTVTFDLGPGTAATTITYPFASFEYDNGPSSWHKIDYWRQ